MEFKIVDYKIVVFFLFSGLVLLPFSTTKDSQFHVISFGMPFLFISGVSGLWYIFKRNILLCNSIIYVLYVSIFYVTAMFLSTYLLLTFPEKYLVSIYRVIPNMIGLLLFLFIISFSSSDKKELRVIIQQYPKYACLLRCNHGLVFFDYLYFCS